LTPALPEVDFQKEQLVVVVFPMTNSVSNYMEIAAIEERPDQLVAYSVLLRPQSGITLETTAVFTHIVAMPRSNKPVVFAPIVESTSDQRPPKPYPSRYMPRF
jgi:hypothetical protein